MHHPIHKVKVEFFNLNDWFYLSFCWFLGFVLRSWGLWLEGWPVANNYRIVFPMATVPSCRLDPQWVTLAVVFRISIPMPSRSLGICWRTDFWIKLMIGLNCFSKVEEIKYFVGISDIYPLTLFNYLQMSWSAYSWCWESRPPWNVCRLKIHQKHLMRKLLRFFQLQKGQRNLGMLQTHSKEVWKETLRKSRFRLQNAVKLEEQINGTNKNKFYCYFLCATYFRI